MEFVLKAN